jgi:hypothetical protein
VTGSTKKVAYYDNKRIAAVKIFVEKALGVNVIKLFTAVIYKCRPF